jgi:DNA-binding HxlR family transcriptional regulator
MVRSGDFCSFEKAVEHLGDRWALLILRELALTDSLGFNALVDSLPGISRSVLTRRLRMLEDFGLIARDSSARPRQAPYRLAPAGLHLLPTLRSLLEWSERWVPEDEGAARRDPDVIAFWLKLRVDPLRLPERPVVVVFSDGQARPHQGWLVLQRAAEPSLCSEDPGLSPERYVYVEAEVEALLPISRGARDWASAVEDRSVRLYGDPDLTRALPSWFRPPAPAEAVALVG